MRVDGLECMNTAGRAAQGMDVAVTHAKLRRCGRPTCPCKQSEASLLSTHHRPVIKERVLHCPEKSDKKISTGEGVRRMQTQVRWRLHCMHGCAGGQAGGCKAATARKWPSCSRSTHARIPVLPATPKPSQTTKKRQCPAPLGWMLAADSMTFACAVI